MTQTCRNARKCRNAIRTIDGERIGALTEGGGLCKACETAAFNAIAHLAADWEGLNAAAGEPFTARGNMSPRVSRSPDRHQAPVRIECIDLARRIDTELARWAWRVDRQALKGMPANAGERVTNNANILTRRSGTLADLPSCEVGIPATRPDGSVEWVTVELDGTDALQRLSKLHRAANRLLGIGGRLVWMNEPCPECARRALRSDPDEGVITCAHCRNSWDSDEFDDLNPLDAAA